MSKTMQLVAADGTAITIDRPTWGYECEVHMPITVVERHPTGYADAFDADDTGAKDYRVLTDMKLQLPASQKLDLNNFLRDASLGRAENFTLRLGSTPTGFFPFGPDLGDVGDFSVRLLSQKQGGMLMAPYKYWQDNISLVLVSAPSYAPASGASQGELQIGTVSGLLYPQTLFNPSSIYNYQTGLSRSGVPYSIDGLELSDSWESSWDQQCNTGNAAALVDYLVSTGRGNDITITTAEDFYAYGMDQRSEGIYKSRFLGSSRSKNELVLKMVCDGFNRWTIPLNFWMKERVDPPVNGWVYDMDTGGWVYEEDTNGWVYER